MSGSFSVRHSPRKFPTNRKKENADRCRRRRGRRIDREKNGTGWKTDWDERNRKRMVRIIGARYEKLPKTKATEKERPGAKLPMKLGFHLQIKIHVVRCAGGKNSTRLLVILIPRRVKTSAFHRFTFFYTPYTPLPSNLVIFLNQRRWLKMLTLWSQGNIHAHACKLFYMTDINIYSAQF